MILEAVGEGLALCVRGSWLQDGEFVHRLNSVAVLLLTFDVVFLRASPRLRASKCRSRDWILSRRSSFSSWISIFSCGLARASTEVWLVSFCEANPTFGSLVGFRSWLMEAKMALFCSIIAINCLSSEGTSCLAFKTLGNNKEFIVCVKLLPCVRMAVLREVTHSCFYSTY